MKIKYRRRNKDTLKNINTTETLEIEQKRNRKQCFDNECITGPEEINENTRKMKQN